MSSAIVDGNDVVAVVRTTREAVDYARAGNGPVLIEAKTMRMLGHAQHDSAEYVPKKMLESWKKRDPLDLFEKVLTEKKLWDAKTKKEIDERIARRNSRRRGVRGKFAVTAAGIDGEGVYCEGCHTIEADWQRPKEEVMPPRSSVKAEWPVKSHAANGARPSARADCRPENQTGKKAGARHDRSRTRQGGTLTPMPETTYVEAIRQAMLEEMDRDPAVVLISEASACTAERSKLPRVCWRALAGSA